MRLDNFIRLAEGELRPKDEKKIKEELTFFPQPDTKVWCYRERASGGLWLPRGVLDLLPGYVELTRDKRSFPKLPVFETNIVLDFQGKNKKFVGQQDAVDSMFENKQGIIHRAPGTGKSNIALYFIAKVGTRTLVIVHTKDLLDQWIGYAERGIPDIDIGIVSQNKEEIGQLTIATVQTLYKRNFDSAWWRQFGCTIIDEVHHQPAMSFDRVLAHSTSRYRFGLSASKTRADKMEPLMRFNIGPVIHDLEFSAPMPVEVRKIKSSFRSGKGAAITGPMWLRRRRYQSIITRLTEDKPRNRKIAKGVSKQLRQGRSVLVLSRRIEHLQLIQRELERLGEPSTILAAKLVPKQKRKALVNEFKRGKIKCVLATQLADEGLDVPILSCVCLAFPGRHTDLILQQVGRALREHAGKESAVILDVVDPHVKTFRSQWHHRRRAYLAWGFSIRKSPTKAVPKKMRKVIFGRIN